MDLSKVVKIFEDVIDPNLSESWDNTGLLIEPSKEKLVSVILFTNDLTDAVLKEATSIKGDLVVSYHPPLFSAIKSLKRTNWKDRIILQCIENSIAVYSPHTACDAVKGGVNDWLINCFGEFYYIFIL
ncbi:NIF3-like protein 1 [Stegodyphus dumicola]|uniref:NIF3-like protein 1 n=1 Tax=Stegodyphus dumicola TaxID=202533 RepID=UPI0015A98C1A|nr:NIF3-like protein 1 [Stegodyphus dumicola]